jgi:hypothetical protein
MRAWGALGVLCAVASASPAMAQSSGEDKALALQLFDEGRALLASGKVDEACRKLEESRRLDPLPGTVLNVAVCHEQQGRAASAIAEFREARALAERDRRDDRVAFVDQHLKALEAKVSSLVIVVPPEADRPDLTIARDGTPVGRAAWGSRIPVDPGQHRVDASAPGKLPWTATLTIAPEGDVKTATLAPLQDLPPASSPPAPPAPEPAPAAVPPPPTPLIEIPAEHAGLSGRRVTALVTLGAGVVAAGLGTYFGVTAIAKHNDPGAVCTAEPCTTADKLNSDATSAADASTVSFAVAAVAVGVGAFLWLGDSSGKRSTTSLRLAPSFAPGRAGVEVGGGF